MVILADMIAVLTPIIIVAVFALVVGLVILIRKKSKFFKDDEKPKSEKEIAKEELDRILEPIEEPLQEVKDDEDSLD